MPHPRTARPARRRLPASPAAKHTDTAAIVGGLRRVVKALHSYSQDVRHTYGLTGPQLWALKTLEARGRLTMGQLAQALAVHQSSLSPLIRRLHRRGLVRRLRGRADKRVVQLELTPRGGALAADAPEPAQGRLLHALDRMPVRRVRQVRDAVGLLVDAMEAGDIEARFFFADA